MWFAVAMSWNGRRKAGPLGSSAPVARFGKNGAIQICGRPPVGRTPKARVDENVSHSIGSEPGPPVVWTNGVQRPHELVTAPGPSAVVSLNGPFVLSAEITHSSA